MELLSPAGNFDALIAAVQSGADAVYLGFGDFNARRSAGNFCGDEFQRAVDYCHARGVKVHVTLNTLLKESELDGFERAAREAERAGADAAIVQDWGGARMIKELCPNLKLHMSTQAACVNASGVRFAMQQGYDRVVLARECSLEEIARCVQQGAEIETFAHGALCVCFSGQCLMSSLVGGRSGNRGMCAQPCRLNYRLTGACEASGCLLSPRDIMMLDDLAALERAGVCSLKIEGRLKRPEYVAEVTRVYRRALDMLREHPERFEPDERDRSALRQIFNRGGFSRAYLDVNFRDRDIIDPTRPNNMGVRVGSVKGARGDALRLHLDTVLDAGDQISLRKDGDETGFELKQHLNAGEVELRVPGLHLRGGLGGAEMYRAASSAQLMRAREYCAGEHRHTRVDMRAYLHVDEPARLELRTAAGEMSDIADICIAVEGACVSSARRAPLDAQNVRAQLGKLGGTPLMAGDVELDMGEQVFLPVSAINELRRAAADAYVNAVLARRHGGYDAGGADDEHNEVPCGCAEHAQQTASCGCDENARQVTPCGDAEHAHNETACISMQCMGGADDTHEDMRQCAECVDNAPRTDERGMNDRAAHAVSGALVIVQSHDIADAVLGDEFYWEPELIGEAELEAEFARRPKDARIYLRLPNMLTEGELAQLVGFARAHAGELSGCVVTNASQLACGLPGKLIADANMNAWNSRALDVMKARGISRAAASLELTAAEIAAAGCAGMERELIVYGRATLMTMRHCPVNARSKAPHGACHLCDSGRGLKDCALVDRKNVRFPLMRYRGASGCYAQILNSAPHDLLGRLDRLPECGAIRLIFTDESAQERRMLTGDARQALEGAGRSAHRAASGATNGHYFRGVE